MEVHPLIIQLEGQTKRINTLIQTVKGNAFTGGQKTAVDTAGTNSINDINDMVDALRTWLADGSATAPAYDDTAAANVNTPIKHPLVGPYDIDGIRIDLSKVVSDIKQELLLIETEPITNGLTNARYTRSGGYNTAVAAAQVALTALKAAIFV